MRLLLFRKEMYEGYKATRKPMPTELASQLAPLKRDTRGNEYSNC